MRTFRTVCATAAFFFLAFFIICVLLCKCDTDLLHRSVYYLFEKSKIIGLILGCSFLLMSLMISAALGKLSKEMNVENDELSFQMKKKDEEPVYRETVHKAVPVSRKNNGAVIKTAAKKKSGALYASEPLNDDDQFAFEECKSINASYSDKNAGSSESKLIYCIYCGAKISSNSTFCEKCGKKV